MFLTKPRLDCMPLKYLKCTSTHELLAKNNLFGKLNNMKATYLYFPVKDTSQLAVTCVLSVVKPFPRFSGHRHIGSSVATQKTLFPLPIKLIRLYKEVSIFSIRADDQGYFCSSLRLKKYTWGKTIHCLFYRTTITGKPFSANRVKRKYLEIKLVLEPQCQWLFPDFLLLQVILGRTNASGGLVMLGFSAAL